MFVRRAAVRGIPSRAAPVNATAVARVVRPKPLNTSLVSNGLRAVPVAGPAARRGIATFAFRGGASLVAVLAAYVLAQSVRRVGRVQLWRMRRHLRAPTSVTSLKKNPLFMDRPEKRKFLTIKANMPGAVTYVTGPDGSGKSTLLKTVAEKRTMTVWLDLHEHPYTTGSELLQAFVEASGFLLPPEELVGRAIFTANDPMRDADRALDHLRRIMEAQREIRWQEALPLIAIDEMRVPSDDKDEHRGEGPFDPMTAKLLDFCLYVTDNKLASVAFACSTEVADALDRHPGLRARREKVYIDYPRETSVTNYLQTTVNARLDEKGRETLDDVAIATIVRTLGGQMQDLSALVAAVVHGSDWSRVLQRFVADRVERLSMTLEDTLDPKFPPNASAEERAARRMDAIQRCLRFWKVLELLAERKYVSRTELLARVFTDCPNELDDLCDQGVLMSANISAATKVYTPSKGSSASVMSGAKGSAVGGKSEDAGGPSAEKPDGKSNSAATAPLVTGRLHQVVAAASPLLRRALQSMLTEKRLQAHRAHLQAAVDATVTATQEQQCATQLAEAINEREFALRDLSKVVDSVDKWDRAFGDGTHTEAAQSSIVALEKAKAEVQRLSLELDEIRALRQQKLAEAAAGWEQGAQPLDMGGAFSVASPAASTVLSKVRTDRDEDLAAAGAATTVAAVTTRAATGGSAQE